MSIRNSFTVVGMVFLALALRVNAQGQGIHFTKGMSWAGILAKARAENKYIFVDCMATWCGPCRQMSSSTFTTAICGKFFNKNFINVTVQLDRTPKDDADTKAWYADAEAIARANAVSLLPTFLFFDPRGILVHKILGATNDAAAFVEESGHALDSMQQVYTCLRRFREGYREPVWLKQTAIALVHVNEMKEAVQVSNAYIHTQKDPYSADNVEFMAVFANSSSSTAFDLYQKDPAAIDKVLGKNVATERVEHILWTELFLPAYKNKERAPDWDSLSGEGIRRWPGLEPVIRFIAARGKTEYFLNKHDYAAYAAAADQMAEQFGERTTVFELNGFAENLARNTRDNRQLEMALGWSKRTLADGKNAYFINTYALILYKMGRKVDALAAEDRAIAMLADEERKAFIGNRQKMERQEAIW